MGLDAADLVFRLEKRFGLTITKTEARAVLFDRVGTVHRYLIAKLRGEYRAAPDTVPLFLEVARAVNRLSSKWTFTHDLNRRFPASTRAESWQALEKELNLSLPPLETTVGESHLAIPKDCASVIALTGWIAEHYPERVEWVPVSCARTGIMANREWTDDEVWEELKGCIVDALGVDEDEVTYDARMVEDLDLN